VVPFLPIVETNVHLRSDSFHPYAALDPRLAFGAHDPVHTFRLSHNRNPHLAWSDVPAGTRSFALLCWDPDVPSRADDVNQAGKTVPLDLPRVTFHHWVVVDLPADLREIAEGSHSDGIVPRGKPIGPTPAGGQTGQNDYTGWFAADPDMSGTYGGYDGPCPPFNDTRVHGYRFAVYALDVPTLGLSGAFTGDEVRRAMAGHVLAEAKILGTYAIHPGAAR
jgi:Raf kinase inhibitor-like YbhB/YbcL family protein